MNRIKKWSLVLFPMFFILIWALCSCNTSEYATITVTESSTFTSSVTLTTTQTGSSELSLADEGYIFIDGKGLFSYRRVLENIDSPQIYRNVTFAPYETGGTIIPSTWYWYTVTFSDGLSEHLRYTGIVMQNVNIEFTEHENPYAGILYIRQ